MQSILRYISQSATFLLHASEMAKPEIRNIFTYRVYFYGGLIKIEVYNY